MYTKRSEDEDVSQIFVERLEHDIRRLYHEYYKFPQKTIYTEADKDTFNKATHCHYVKNHSKQTQLEIIVI